MGRAARGGEHERKKRERAKEVAKHAAGTRAPREVLQPRAKKHPRLRLVFREAKTEDVVRELWAGSLDVGLVALVPEVADLAHAEVRVDPFVVALPHGHPLARKKRIALEDLDDAPVLLLDDGHCFRSQALGLCARAGARELELRATSLATLAQMVSAGLGITLLPEVSVPVENRRGQLEIRPFAPHKPSRTIALVWRPQSPFADAFRALAARMRKA